MARSLLDTIDTKTCRWLARGQLRDIYQHPDHPEALIKVIREDRVDGKGNVVGWSRQKFVANRQFGIYITFLREFREVMRGARRMFDRPDVLLPYARVVGLARTERGLGLTVEKITGPDGELAPSLKRLIKDGSYTPLHREKLDAFFDFCAENHFIFGDLNAGNLVYVGEGAHGRFVCVDGIGEKVLVPVHEVFPVLNRRKLRRMQRRIHAYVERRLRDHAKASRAAVPQPNLPHHAQQDSGPHVSPSA